MRGLLVVFEGLDQSGKQTQAERLRDRLVAAGRTVRLLSFPSYDTPIGAEIGRALHGEREYPADTMQLLFVANRSEWKPEIERELARGTVIVCDRYRGVEHRLWRGVRARPGVADRDPALSADSRT